MRQPFNNKSNYDPGRLRYTLSFFEQGGALNEFGNSTPTTTASKQLKAAKLQIGTYDQFAIQEGASVLRNDVYFIIRYRTDWAPDKTMTVTCEDKTYKVHSIIELNQPTHYWKLLCIWQG